MTDNVIANEDLLTLERDLRLKLRPVMPDQKFVGSLRRKLEQEVVQDHGHCIASGLLTIAAGIMIGLIIFLIGKISVRQEN